MQEDGSINKAVSDRGEQYVRLIKFDVYDNVMSF